MGDRPAPRPMAADRGAPQERSGPPVQLPDDLPPLRSASTLARPAQRPGPPAEMPAPQSARPVPPGATIQRVREPERDTPDPGGPDDDLEDPFSDEDEPPARQAPRPTAPRAPARRPTRNDGGGLL